MRGEDKGTGELFSYVDLDLAAPPFVQPISGINTYELQSR